jgi:peptidoglycan/LPS O-acetylase OafA/YrhL
MDRHRRVLGVWSGAALCTALAWIVATSWPDQWPAAVAVLVFFVAVIAAIAVSVAGTTPSQQ